MHAYIRALGFSKDVSFREMETIIRAGLGTAAEGGRLHVLEDKKKVFYRVPLGMDYGISVVCDYDDRDSDNPYILDYYTPYLIPEVNKKVDNLYIERHVANDSYGVLCDEIKDDATIVTFLDNAYEMNLITDEIKGVSQVMLGLSGFSLEGTILLPIKKLPESEVQERKNNRRKNIELANKGDEEAMEQLALEDIDNFYSVARRIGKEDIFTIVESTFIPCGVECETYSVLGEIMSLTEETNIFTGRTCYNMLINCDDVIFNLLINKDDLTGEPKVGRRFKGRVWLMAHVNFTNDTNQQDEE